MLTKIKLIINNITHDLANNCIKNWEDISCSYKRDDYSGIVRSFTSQFEFVNEAYDLLLNHFQEKGFNAKAVFELYALNDNWEYDRMFGCDLDFSTISWTNTVLKINAVDNSIAAIIKANKSTKYELVIDEDIPTAYPYEFDRVQITETATYSISDGESNDDGSLSGTYSTDNNYRIYVGRTNMEIGVGGFVMTKEDQEYGDGYMLSGINSTTVVVDYNIGIDIRTGCAALVLMNGDSELKTLTTGISSSSIVQFRSWITWNTIDEVKAYIADNVDLSHSWGTEDWSNHFVVVAGIVWGVMRDVTNTNDWYNTGKTLEEYVVRTYSGQFTFTLNKGDKIWLKFNSAENRNYRITSSEIKFSWSARGGIVQITAVHPIDIIESILMKMGACDVEISDYDSRLNDTLLLAAESIRGIPNARIYSSFNDFCNWMETVFGYTYIIDEDAGIMRFVHRKEIFSDNAPIKEIENAVDLEYSVESGTLYSNVVVGYDKQDYESVNGRDEFNFNNCYITGYTITDKKIELKSKYRADSYGIEFLVQKRSADTTDNESDDDIFFVLGSFVQDKYKTVRDTNIENTNSNTLINGEFSPIECIYANADYIGMMANSIELTFASSEGNSNVVINGVAISDTLYLEDLEMLSSGILKFLTDDVNIPTNLNSIIKVETQKFIYTGYIKEVEIKYSRQSSVEYTLIVKSRELCS